MEPLPPRWELGHTAEGVVYYIDHSTRTTSWIPPALPANRPPPRGGGGAAGGDGDRHVQADLQRRLANKQADLRTISAMSDVGPEQLRPLQEEIARIRAAIVGRIPEGVPPPQPRPRWAWIGWWGKSSDPGAPSRWLHLSGGPRILCRLT
jgi:hypothetical protein